MSNHTNHTAIVAVQPFVGLRCTAIVAHDKRAKTIVKVVNSGKVIVAENNVKCIDYLQGIYRIYNTINKSMPTEVYIRKADGLWVKQGNSTGSVVLDMLVHQHYIDPFF